MGKKRNRPATPFVLTIAAVLATLWAGLLEAQQPSTSLPARQLRVGEDGRFLEFEDGTPFFYVGDTAWELFHRLDAQEADIYLRDRSEKGFNVVQAVVLAQLGGLDVPNANGDLPLVSEDPFRINEPYFSHVDEVVARANELGIVVAMLPTWGSYWSTRDNDREPLFDAVNAEEFGRFLGDRYRDELIIWVLGGDENVRNARERTTITAMARGLRDGDGGRHLITFHPRGPGRSSEFFHGAEWLDFNMSQSSHAARGHDNGLFVSADLALDPLKPTLDGEPRYEQIPVGFYNADATDTDRFDDDDTRQAAYLAVMAGACGHTYGNNNIWQMWDTDRDPVIGANVPWYLALDHPGAFQMGHLRRLFESRPFNRLRPDPSLVIDGRKRGPSRIRALLDCDSKFAFVYSHRGDQFTVRLDSLDAPRVRAAWFDPRYGTTEVLHSGDNTGFQTFVPPTSGPGRDWVLILDDAAARFPLPGPGKASGS